MRGIAAKRAVGARLARHRSRVAIMDARDPVEAVEILDLLLKFFGEGERWIKGRFSDRRGSCCLVGALDFVSSHHAARGEAAERYLADVLSDPRDQCGDYTRLR